jgi:hypothetical protein
MTKKIQGLTIQFLPYSEIEILKSGDRIKKILDIILDNKIVVIQGKLKSEEEARLIEDTMALVGRIKGFRGVELAVISPDVKKRDMFSNFKHGIANALVGNTDSLTVIGPASIIKEMKKDPRKLEIIQKR